MKKAVELTDVKKRLPRKAAQVPTIVINLIVIVGNEIYLWHYGDAMKSMPVRASGTLTICGVNRNRLDIMLIV